MASIKPQFIEIHKKLSYFECIDDEWWEPKDKSLTKIDQTNLCLLRAFYEYQLNHIEKINNILKSGDTNFTNNTYYFLLLGLLEELKSENDLAEKYFMQSKELQNDQYNPWIYLHLYYFYKNVKSDNFIASSYLYEGIERYNNFAPLLLEKYFLLKNDDENKALSYILDLSEKINDPYINLLIARIYYENDEIEKGWVILNKAIEQRPSAGGFLLKGDILFYHKNDLISAEKNYKLAIEIGSCSSEGFRALGKFYMEIDDLKKSEEFLLLALDVEYNTEIIFDLINVKILQKEYLIANELLSSITIESENKKDVYLLKLIILYYTDKKEFLDFIQQIKNDVTGDELEWIRNEAENWEISW